MNGGRLLTSLGLCFNSECSSLPLSTFSAFSTSAQQILWCGLHETGVVLDETVGGHQSATFDSPTSVANNGSQFQNRIL